VEPWHEPCSRMKSAGVGIQPASGCDSGGGGGREGDYSLDHEADSLLFAA
jgi:hypothetical protein